VPQTITRYDCIGSPTRNDTVSRSRTAVQSPTSATAPSAETFGDGAAIHPRAPTITLDGLRGTSLMTDSIESLFG
jgi:hypothetical protein